MTRNEAIRRIRAGLKKRSGHVWSVTGGRGTAYGWLTIDAPPSLRRWDSAGTTRTGQEYGYPSLGTRIALQRLMGENHPARQGYSIPASTAHYLEAVERAETGAFTGKPPEQYWD